MDNELTLTCTQVTKLDFVDHVNFPGHVPMVFVILSRRLVASLPMGWHLLQFAPAEFRVDTVLIQFEPVRRSDYILKLVSHEYYEAAQVATEMLKTAKQQANFL